MSVDGLTASQLTALRNATAKMQAIGDNRGFAALAGIHGWPQYRCKHSSETARARLFLPWHRAYLYEFELSLYEQDSTARLPWWDWPASRQSGIPAAYADEDTDGQPNPLAGSALPTDIPNPPQDWTAATYRTPADPAELPDAKAIEAIIGIADYYDFELALETQLHNLVHEWVGGSMGEVNTAAYDPLFWAHHTMVDRIWSLWQSAHASPGPPQSTFATALGFGELTVGAVLDTAKLGYDYAASIQHVAIGAGG
ncbi:MAG TPA: tyrosinase family protein [Solirubrobacteraceae bacterium]|nr:tyrosinase family protein [Solirubrobacteraceae bacterium]